MARFIFIMQHVPTTEQLQAAAAVGEVVQLADKNKKMLNVPDDPGLGRDWFVQRAAEIETAVGGFGPGDTVQAMGQQQLAMALNARALAAGATLAESVTARKAVEVPQPDGTVKKESVFEFRGFRPIYQF